MHISEISVKRPVTTTMFFLAVVLIGIVSLTRLSVDLLPDLSYPRLTIWTKYPNVPPQEVEARVTRNIETALQTIHGVKKISSISQEGLSLVSVDFNWGTNMDFTSLTVREQLDRQYYENFKEAERPIIIRVDPSSQPIMSLSASGEDLLQLKEYSRAILKRRLEQIDGVALATVTGGLDREIHVDVDVDRMLALGVGLQEISNALSAANESRPGGYIRKGNYRYSLRTKGEFQSVEQLDDVVVGRNENSIIYLRDVAKVSDSFRDRDNITRYNGNESIGIIIQKQSGSNTVTVAGKIKEVLEQLQEEFPDVSISIAYNQADFITRSINTVLWAIAMGGILAFLVLFLFLHDARNPVNISIAIPISIIAAFSLLFFADVSLNIMSLGGLALGVGMLVDNSIVVLENIFRHKQEGKSIIQAAIDGSKEVSLAVSASTFTTISVFFPIIFVEGIAGQLFRDQSLTITFSLLCSLIVSLTLLPMLASHFFQFKKKELEPLVPFSRTVPPSNDAEYAKVSSQNRFVRIGRQVMSIVLFPLKGIFYWVIWRFLIKTVLAFIYFLILNLLQYWVSIVSGFFNFVFTPVFKVFDRVFERILDSYERFLQWALDNRVVIIVITIVISLFSFGVGITLDRELIPPVDQRQFEIEVFLPIGTTLEQTDRIALIVTNWLLDIEDIESVFSSVGIVRERGLQSGQTSSLNRGLLLVKLTDTGTYSTEEVMQIIRAKENQLPIGTLNFTSGETTLQQVLGTDESDIVINVKGEDYSKTYVMMEQLINGIRQIEGLADIRSSYEEGKPEIRITIDRFQADRYGLSVRQVSNFIANAMSGNTATQFTDFDRKIDIVVRPHASYRDDFDDLLNSIVPQDGVYIPFRELIHYEFTKGPNEIRREGQVRQIQVYANIHERNYKDIVTEIGNVIDTIEIPGDDYEIILGGENEEMQRSFRSLILALLVSVALVYMILAAQFESLLQPFVIMFSVPLALIGVAFALYLTDSSINVLSAIGIIILVGIVVNDAIIKVDFINQMRKRGMALREAILEAGKKRFRPIIMTTVTTVLALTPMAFGLVGRGAGLQTPMAIAVIGGLLSSTFLTLIIIPVIYSYIGGLRIKQ